MLAVLLLADTEPGEASSQLPPLRGLYRGAGMPLQRVCRAVSGRVSANASALFLQAILEVQEVLITLCGSPQMPRV